MGAFHQMGHQSDNLVSELSGYDGVILSPVNYSKSTIQKKVISRYQGELEIIFDPQLYFPKSQRAKLPNWEYFPNDVDTADVTSMSWWKNLCRNLKDVMIDLSPDAVCSPIDVYRSYDIRYFEMMLNVTAYLKELLDNTQIGVIHSLAIRLMDLTSKDRVLELASVITSFDIDRVYLIFIDDTEPRRELKNTESLKLAMLLIKKLAENKINTLIGYSSTDLVLWKYAGADSCATGKFFNLRRFTPSRWDDAPEGGGGQLPYWIEDGLLGFFRESDILRLGQNNLVSETSKQNPYYFRILENIQAGEAWLGDSWRFYMSWFRLAEEELGKNPQRAVEMLKVADRNWGILEDTIILEERKNDGQWIRAWRRAVIEFEQ